MKLEPITPRTEGFWREIFMDPSVQKNLFIPPVRDGDFQKWAYSGNRFCIILNDIPIGIASLFIKNRRCFFGYALHPKERGKGHSSACIQIIEEKAKELGCGTITTNVAKNNQASIKALEKGGFRSFIWMEKNKS